MEMKPKRLVHGIRTTPFDRTDKVVCKRCHIVMSDLEPCGSTGEFYHPTGIVSGRPVVCPNAGKTFIGGDTEVVPFVRKSMRRRIKRNSAHRTG